MLLSASTVANSSPITATRDIKDSYMPLSPAVWNIATPCLQVCPLAAYLNYSRYTMPLYAYLAACRSMTVSLQSCVTFFTGCQSKSGLTLRLEY